MTRYIASFLAGLGFALAVAARPLATAANETSRSYLATFEASSQAGVTRVRETLTLRRAGGTAVVSVSDANGASLSLPTALGPDGEIEQNLSDPSVTCYNMAVATLYSNAHASEQPATIFMRFGNETVGVPMSVHEENGTQGNVALSASGRRTFAAGDGVSTEPVQVAVDARVEIASGVPTDVVFSESTALGEPAVVVSRTTCRLQQPRKTTPFPRVRLSAAAVVSAAQTAQAVPAG